MEILQERCPIPLTVAAKVLVPLHGLSQHEMCSPAGGNHSVYRSRKFIPCLRLAPLLTSAGPHTSRPLIEGEKKTRTDAPVSRAQGRIRLVWRWSRVGEQMRRTSTLRSVNTVFVDEADEAFWLFVRVLCVRRSTKRR
jgi:hypothetical protein